MHLLQSINERNWATSCRLFSVVVALAMHQCRGQMLSDAFYSEVVVEASLRQAELTVYVLRKSLSVMKTFFLPTGLQSAGRLSFSGLLSAFRNNVSSTVVATFGFRLSNLVAFLVNRSLSLHVATSSRNILSLEKFHTVD